MYTFKDLAADKFVLLNEYNLIEIEGVNSISTLVVSGKRKRVTAHIGLFEYLFGSTLKSAITTKVKKDLGTEFDFSFGI